MVSASSQNEPIAIIGSGCRFPGGINSPSQLWDLLTEPRDLLTRIPSDRFNVDAFYHPDGSHHGKTNVQHAYLLTGDTRTFDASFFNIKPHEAECIDPQQRMLLETVFDSLCAAGLKVEDLQNSNTATYVGVMSADYADILYHDLNSAPTYTATGSARSIISNRLAYFFNWHGPSMTIDTACSSSLVAMHHAVQALRNGESDVAVAAGANLILGPNQFIVESKLSMLSPEGRSRMWDADANGYARGDGIASVIMKTLSKALADGDHIECIVRETGVNQDGRTPGITMPSHSAQEALIRQTYAKAGLDITNIADRCQYFEAHGTGTPAGDPQEAEAISRAFFDDVARQEGQDPLFVGSIKTIIGHTEGTAGLAGVIKASLAVQHGIVPPNMLFNSLSAKVAPFYKDLQILTAAKAWPQLAPGQPRRASVNSFGFGGTNAHAIIESYSTGEGNLKAEAATSVSALTMSAHNEKALRESMSALLDYLRATPDVCIRDLLWTFQDRKSVMAVRKAVPAQSVESLCTYLEAELEAIATTGSTAIKAETRTTPPAILGVFTGQGAQWPAMGKKLIEASETARSIVQDLDRALQSLPPKDRPQWSLITELELEGTASHVTSAKFSQPLCTAVQILLVDLLNAAGITFKAVVGHSSGEIGCAYASGCLSAIEAIRVAYYRGVVTQLAGGASGNAGAMMAIGTTLMDAQELCHVEIFDGRISVAACNSGDSITLSGDLDAIEHAKMILDDEQKFARLLKVDKAYHSHHMLPCARPYVQALTTAVNIGKGPVHTTNDTIWISSVDAGKKMTRADANATYWKDNMVSPVFFSQALVEALKTQGPFDVVVEVGPHPALKGPASSNIQAETGGELPYTGCLSRGTDEVNTFIAGLSYLWERFGPASVDFAALDACLFPTARQARVLKGLPIYPWDHSRSYWVEPRLTKAYFKRETLSHELLGELSANSTSEMLQWSNLLRVKEIPWLGGHQLQGQTVFPASAYAVMAMEAAKFVAAGRPVSLIEIHDLTIGKAITFDSDSDTVEINFTLNQDMHTQTEKSLKFQFSCDSSLAKESTLSLSAAGQVIMFFDEENSTALPPAQDETPLMSDVSIDTFYHELSVVGYGYQKEFRGIADLRRSTNCSAGTLRVPQVAKSEQLVIHPAPLDVAFQAFIAAFCAPGDGRLYTLHVPVGFKRIAVNPMLCCQAQSAGLDLEFCSNISSELSDSVGGDIDVYIKDSRETVITVEQVSFKPFTAPTKAEDRTLFSQWTWAHLEPDHILVDDAQKATEDEKHAVFALERATYFYTKQLLAQLTTEVRSLAAPHFNHMFEWAEHIVSQAREGKHAYYDQSWATDTQATIDALVEQFKDRSDIMMVDRVGRNLMEVVNDNANMLQVMTKDGLLSEFYREALGFRAAHHYTAKMVGQIAHRYANMEILEIGAGAGDSTKAILSAVGDAFNGYTFTDISADSFKEAQPQFAEYADRMSFQTLDISQPVGSQGFKEHAYDLIVFSNVLHAPRNLSATLKHCRQLLKAGGRVILPEITSTTQTWLSFIFGTLSGWWEGAELDAHKLGPIATIEQWENVMQETGFTSLESRTEQTESVTLPFSVFSSQATDRTTAFLAAPKVQHELARSEPIYIIGGRSSISKPYVDSIQATFKDRVCTVVSVFADLHDITVTKGSTFVVLSELDEELFAHLDDDKFEAVKVMFYYARNVLWLTEDAYTEHPYQLMIAGMCRTLRLEYPECGLQILDLENAAPASTDLVTEVLLRLELSHDLKPSEILWTTESELRVVNNRFIVPRLKPDDERNDRYNSKRRRITKAIDTTAHPVELRNTSGGCDLYAAQDLEQTSTEMTAIDVDYSTAVAIRAPSAGYMYLVCGRLSDTGKRVIGLAAQNASKVLVNKASVVEIDNEDAAKQLHKLTLNLVASNILSNANAGSTVLVHESSSPLAREIKTKAEKSGISVKFSTSKQSEVVEHKDWIYLHPRTPHQQLQRKLPTGISAFFDLSGNAYEGNLGRSIQACLLTTCSIFDRSYLYSDTAVSQSASLISLANFYDATSVSQEEDNSPLEVTSIHDLDSESAQLSASSIVDWTAKKSSIVDARVLSMDEVNMFSNDKTYIMVGLTGDLGRSLCRWMLKRGARYIVLLSRNPRIDPAWLSLMAEEGGVVTTKAMDAANWESVKDALESIEKEMPPIGGVSHGPLVLQDAMFENMDVETMEMVVDSKVKGAVNLERYFGDRQLEFFVYFSSLVAAAGNKGQCNYSAANLYLTGAAARRRKRGLAASCINISAVAGVGFIARAARESDYTISKVMFMPVSEQDLQHQYAEAVIAGRPTSTDTFEITTGMPYNDPENREHIPMIDEPRLAFYKLPERSNLTSANTASGRPVKELLAEATSLVQAQQVIHQAIADKLRSALQIPAEDSMEGDMPLIDQGVDSLVAVTLRTWFSKELNLDVPVLKVLGGASIADLASDAAQRLAPTLATKSDAADTNGGADSDLTDDDTASSNDMSDISSDADLAGDSGDGTSTPSTATSEDDEEAPPKDYKMMKSVAAHDQMTLVRKENLSFGQSRFWQVKKSVEDETVSNVTIGMWLEGAMDVARLSRTIKRFVSRHETFRTRFIEEGADSQPMQNIMSKSLVELEVIPCADRDAAMEGYNQMQHYKYDLESGKTCRMVLFTYGPQQSFFVIAYHHIISDGWGFEMMVKELDTLYINNGVRAVPAVQQQYAEFANRQREEVQQGAMAEEQKYWQTQYKQNAPPRLPRLPLTTTATIMKPLSWNFVEASVRLEPMVAARIKDRSRKQKANAFHFYLAAYYVLLARLTKVDDICIGLAEANRSGAQEDMTTMGYFINLLPIRMSYDPSQTFGDAIVHARNQARDSMTHSKLPFEAILQQLGIAGIDNMQSPLFQAFLDYKQGQSESGKIGPGTMSGVEMSRARTGYDITIEVTEDPTKDPLIVIKLQNNHYSQEDVNLLLRSYVNMLQIFSRNPAVTLNEPKLFAKVDLQNSPQLATQ